MKNINLEFEDIIGRYFNLKVKKQNYRIYVEEAGKELRCYAFIQQVQMEDNFVIF